MRLKKILPQSDTRTTHRFNVDAMREAFEERALQFSYAPWYSLDRKR